MYNSLICDDCEWFVNRVVYVYVILLYYYNATINHKQLHYTICYTYLYVMLNRAYNICYHSIIDFKNQNANV